jgi:uncharacterized protein YjbI with pentapeptide repeats
MRVEASGIRQSRLLEPSRGRVAVLMTTTAMILLLSFLALAPSVSAAPTGSVIRASGSSSGTAVCFEGVTQTAPCFTTSSCPIPQIPAWVTSEEIAPPSSTINTLTDTGAISATFVSYGYVVLTSDGGYYTFDCNTATATIDGSTGTMVELAECSSLSLPTYFPFVCNLQDLPGSLGVHGGGLYLACVPASTCPFYLSLGEWSASYSNCDWFGTLSPGSNLAGCNLPGVNFAGANLRGDNMARANFAGATSLPGDSLPLLVTSANLAGASLQGANLNGADLRGANLNSANLAGANLHDANLNGADLTNANFAGANCQGATDVGASGTSTTITTGSNHCP